MKTRSLLFLICSAILAGGCGRREAEPLPQGLAERATETGREVSGAFMVRLKGRLLETIEADGPAAAIRVCHEDAGAITAGAAEGAGVLDVRRTSLRWRNPKNRPTALDEVAWKHFEDTDGPVRLGLEDWVTIESGDSDRIVYYRALRTLPLCITCHGPEDQIPSEVRDVLAALYPDDRAVGFREGDLRGLLRIDLDRKILEEAL